MIAPAYLLTAAFSPKGIRFTFADASGISPVSYQMILKDLYDEHQVGDLVSLTLL